MGSLLSGCLSDEDVLACVRLMARHDGKFVCIYKDDYGHEIKSSLAASKVLNAYVLMDNEEAMAAYIETQNDSVTTSSILEMGYTDFSCRKDGNNMVITYTSDCDYEALGITQQDFQDEEETYVSGIVADYQNNPVAKACMDYMSLHGGEIVYVYRDANGKEFKVSFPAIDIFFECN